MNLAVIGAGYVGLVTGACLADVGNKVHCVDSDPAKLRLLRGGHLPIYEPGLEALVARNTASGRLVFTADLASAVADADVVFIAVGTPPCEDGAADLGHVLQAALDIARTAARDTLVVVKSTVPVGTCDRVREVMEAELARRGVPHELRVASNPEFLKEGHAIDDFQRPDRIVIGTDDDEGCALLRALYAPYNRNRDRLICMDIRSAEFTKYASNAMLAARISLMNELADLAERVQADIEAVRRGTGADPRIGYHFLYAGAGYGGSCLPKDVRALIRLAEEYGAPTDILSSVQAVNLRQRTLLYQKLERFFRGRLAGRTVAVWGLAFKPETDDIREAPAIYLAGRLLRAGATVRAYDPAAGANALRALGGERFSIAEDAYAACQDADALVVMTEWREFKSPDFRGLARLLRGRAVFDARNLYDPRYVEACGLRYEGVGRMGQEAARPAPAATSETAR
ncbi:MAG: UDP-glucose/GDP-mannose dehydrogenase family protein [Pigmentiphaga sp.]|uniref:UDP-glucose dehydrogenase family protein n=1 Tax=Pigmentiphaga sp. TaxID=1977564 RepID=UPI0029B7E9D4|nr:UDP-glucose/GDP-mannose dehydrogenase family protein [Pigmentiphaga sp.]MDX3907853.1 UDP-glucose/GDP-mannose dehydrogenase family protein [Pigmentiphaga sp.]